MGMRREEAVGLRWVWLTLCQVKYAPEKNTRDGSQKPKKTSSVKPVIAVILTPILMMICCL